MGRVEEGMDEEAYLCMHIVERRVHGEHTCVYVMALLQVHVFVFE